jgi:hypothetical protein
MFRRFKNLSKTNIGANSRPKTKKFASLNFKVATRNEQNSKHNGKLIVLRRRRNMQKRKRCAENSVVDMPLMMKEIILPLKNGLKKKLEEMKKLSAKMKENRMLPCGRSACA